MKRLPAVHVLRRLVILSFVGLILSACSSTTSLDGATQLSTQGTPQRLFYGYNGLRISTKAESTPRYDELVRINQGYVHILGNVSNPDHLQGYIATTPQTNASSFTLTFEYCFGARKYSPRNTGTWTRDNGVLYHVEGSAKPWPQSKEFQVVEPDDDRDWRSGDLWLLNRTSATPVRADRSKVFQANYRSGMQCSAGLDSDWNDGKVVVNGNTIQHYVNGRLVLTTTRTNTGPGAIALQIEWAEMHFRNIIFTPL